MFAVVSLSQPFARRMALTTWIQAAPLSLYVDNRRCYAQQLCTREPRCARPPAYGAALHQHICCRYDRLRCSNNTAALATAGHMWRSAVCLCHEGRELMLFCLFDSCEARSIAASSRSRVGSLSSRFGDRADAPRDASTGAPVSSAMMSPWEDGATPS